jgi:hypothetical protein
VHDTGPRTPPTFRLGGGDYRRPKEKVEPAFLDCLDSKEPVIQPAPGHSDSSGRRLALARWLTEPDHPLTSRVIVNRIWHHYFGQGIVGTPNDFGAMGQKATHPELLDWLASELVAKNWSLKAVHRLIVTSATYRQSSAPEHNPRYDTASKADPSNRLLWHTRVRRRDAESLRDTALQASGLLNERMLNESACPDLPPVLRQKSRSWSPDEKVEDRNRRSVYVFNRRNLTYPLFEAFDAPNRSLSCPTRNATVNSTQALLMLNGEFSLQQAQALAGRLLAVRSADFSPQSTSGLKPALRTALAGGRLAVGSADFSPHGERGLKPALRTGLTDFVCGAYQQVLGREPNADEVSQAEQFVQRQAHRLADEVTAASLPEPMPDNLPKARGAALVDLCHALLNGAEFWYVD